METAKLMTQVYPRSRPRNISNTSWVRPLGVGSDLEKTVGLPLQAGQRLTMVCQVLRSGNLLRARMLGGFVVQRPDARSRQKWMSLSLGDGKRLVVVAMQLVGEVQRPWNQGFCFLVILSEYAVE